MKLLSIAARLLPAVFAAFAAGASADTIGAAALQARHADLATRARDNPLGPRLFLESREAARRIEGDAYAILDHPFADVAAALGAGDRWCDILILHLNTKYCRVSHDGGASRLALRVGGKTEQSLNSASLLEFQWRQIASGERYFAAGMDARDGPYDTRDYRLVVEAVPIDAQHTFLHMGYGFSYDGASHIAMHLYLATVGRNKVGFSREDPARADSPFVGGMRGVVERNTMRYYLAIDVYLASLRARPGEQVERRLADWFDATERYPRQLREVDKDAYVRMKRAEIRRQEAS